MIEDTQSGNKMLQNSANLSLMPQSSAVQKQPENSRGKSRESFNGGQLKSNKRPPRSFKQNNGGGRRDNGFSKNSKKMQHAHMAKNSSDVNFGDDHEEPYSAYNLLNFQYAPLRSSNALSQHNYKSSGGGGVRRRTRNVTFNKEAFLQANCHFVVDDVESNDYLINTVDPDVLVDWKHIQLVYMPTHGTSECPICLYPPKASKMTRCGHIFCWSCILHYLKLGDKNWRKCPICHEALHENDLKSVVLCERKKYSRLDNITLKLMRRSKDSLIPLPINEWDYEKTQLQIWNNHSFDASSKLMLASSKSIVDNVLLREKDILEYQLQEALADQSGDECFIQLALDRINNKIKCSKESSDEKNKSDVNKGEVNKANVVINKSKENEDEVDIKHKFEGGLAALLSQSKISVDDIESTDIADEAEHLNSEDNENAPSIKVEETEMAIHTLDYIEGLEEETPILDRVTEDELTELTAAAGKYDDEMSRRRQREYSESSTSSEPHNIRDKNSFYFYQSEDGQNIFLNSLNARCIIEEYGGLDAGPIGMTGQIIDFECYTMTKELRKRYRYLAHLPIACEFIICELMLRPPVLSKHTIKSFMPEFKKRKAARSKKLEEQRKFDHKASDAINKQGGFRVEYYSDDEVVNIDLNDQINFPSSFSPPDNGGVDSSIKNTPSDDMKGQASFAQIMRAQSTGKKETSSSTAWNYARAMQQSSLSPQVTNNNNRPREHDDPEDGPDIYAPSYKEMFSAALYTAPIEKQISLDERAAVKKAKGKKKKNNKGMLLFGTGGQRKY